MSPLKATITVDRVSFCYDEKKPILKDASFRFEKGKKYALTGPSGCGKSTLLKLLLGWLPDYIGTISFDDVDIHTVTPAQLHAVVASEIQKLSSQSDSTASKIQEIITDLQNDSKETLEVMRSTEVLVREQYEKLAATKERFKEVGNGINVSKRGTDVIKGNAQVCDSSRVTVVDVISNLSAISEENAASTQQTTSSMQELNATINILAETAAKVKEVSDQLNEDMKYFKM